VIEGLSLLQQHGHPLIVLSNQSGIGRGMFTERDVQRVNDRISSILGGFNIEILAWYICPHAPEADCGCRKPLPGMALDAARDWKLELTGSYVIGDKRSDLELADAIGATGILVTTGHGRDAVEWAAVHERPAVGNLEAAAGYILESEQA
jgi:D-glycero-D-manno-heptose 1,7-bisphosphate phosphatase